ncbi:MAG: OmpA family protein [Bacteroidetes bacterium]|nr:OmpA family protein [Bacteroidota bacterium]
MKAVATVLLLLFASQVMTSQNTDRRIAIGIRGGANMWFNDYKDRKMGGGGELMLRYGFSRVFSLGVAGGVEQLKVEQKVTDPQRPEGYLKLDAYPVSLIGWFNLAPGSRVSPFLYVGVGGMIYKRQNGFGIYVEENKYYNTFHIPVGFALEAFAGKSVSIVVDLGYRFMDEWTDNVKIEGSMPDGYATAKVGLHFYLGSSDSDDDDFDGLTNGEEAKLGTNPNNPDTDRDGLRDGEEVKRYGTDPLNPDTDSDGLTDGVEVRTYKTDPKVADTDGDGLNDGDEVRLHGSSPLKVDTDADGLKDGAEVTVHLTNPSNPDTDSDALNDGDEVNVHRTDPKNPDTDGGTARDGVEVTRGTNPLDPADDIKKPELKAEVGVAIVLQGITFRSGSAQITPASEQKIQTALNTLRQNPEIIVEIRGHTDNTGSRTTNLRLSRQRAESVRNYLVNRGIAPQRITAVGMGPDYPIAPNTTGERRATNRRIEFYRIK